MVDDVKINLVVFLTRGISLRTWDVIGVFDREVAIYLALRDRGVQVSLVTCGGREDLELAPRLPGVRILCNRWGLPVDWYVRLIPLIHAESLRRATVIKTNQMKGAELALKAAQWWRKPLLARCGYLWSEFEANAHGPEASQAEVARIIEKKAFSYATQSVVTTEDARQAVINAYGLEASRVNVIPNYVDTSVFTPLQSQVDSPGLALSFVGRLSEQKNVLAMVEALAGCGLSIKVIGDGPLRVNMERAAVKFNVDVLFLGAVPNHEIPQVLRSSQIFVLPSLYEGHPKTLIEAMACGAPVIGSDVPGIREVIRHGETGWLCGTDPESIKAAILHLMGNPELRAKLGANARKFALENYSLEKIVELELAVYRKIVEEGH